MLQQENPMAAINSSPITHKFFPCLNNFSITEIWNNLIEKIVSAVKWIFPCFFRSPDAPPQAQIQTAKKPIDTQVQIRKLLITPKESKEDAPPLLQQAKEIYKETQVHRGRPDEHHIKLQQAHAEIGQMLFVAQQEEYTLVLDPKKTVSSPPPLNVQVISRNEINTAFKNLLSQISERIKSVEADNTKWNIQDPKKAVAIATAKEIGIALVSPNGALNTGIMNDLRGLFRNEPLQDYEKDILRVLDALEKNQKVQTIFDSIKKPNSSNLQICKVIRAVLGLSPDEEITDNHAKQTALIALLSHLRQGPVGSCFATYLAIGLLNQRLEKCLQDFAEIILTGKALRKINTHDKSFYFVLKIADDAKTTKFELDRNGNAFDIPGIKAAFKQMKIDNLNAKKAEVLQTLFQNQKQATLQINAEELLSYFGTHEQTEMGLFAFSCVTNNGLLRVWENILASMSESTIEGYNKVKLINAIMDGGLKEQLKTSAYIKGKPTVNPVKDAIKTRLEERINLVYDSSIKDEGGYILKEVSNLTEFRTWVVDILKNAQKLVPGKDADTTFTKLVTYVSKDPQFLNNVIWSFDDANKKVQNPVGDVAACKNLPYRFEAGNTLRSTFAAEMQRPVPLPILAHPKSALDFAANFLKVCLAVKKSTDTYKNNLPTEMIPVETPTHAFNALIETDKIKNFLAVAKTEENPAGKTPENWLKDNLVDPSKAAVRGAIDKESRDRITQYISNPVNKLIPDNKIIEFRVKTQGLQATMQTENFAKKMLEIIIELNQPDPVRKKELHQLLSAYLLSDGLSATVRGKLEDAELYIGDLSWEEQGSDLEFKIIFDVVTMSPLLVGYAKIIEQSGDIRRVKNFYKVVNQDEWVKILIKFYPTNYEDKP